MAGCPHFLRDERASQIHGRINGFRSSYLILNPEGWKMLIQDMFKPPDFIYLNVLVEALLPKTHSMKSSIYLVAGTMSGISSVVCNYGDPQDQ